MQRICFALCVFTVVSLAADDTCKKDLATCTLEDKKECSKQCTDLCSKVDECVKKDEEQKADWEKVKEKCCKAPAPAPADTCAKDLATCTLEEKKACSKKCTDLCPKVDECVKKDEEHKADWEKVKGKCCKTSPAGVTVPSLFMATFALLMVVWF